MILRVCLIGVLSIETLFPLESGITIGREDGWKDIISFESVTKKRGRWGDLDLVLADAGASAREQTDLMINFDSHNFTDESAHYYIGGEMKLVSEVETAFGKGSGLFDGDINTLTITPRNDALFSPGIWWTDVTISFWLYPVTLGNGEVVFSWDGVRTAGEGVLHQALSCTFRNRRLLWNFTNFFVPPDRKGYSMKLYGITPLLPRRWHHHMVRFDSRSGLLEYCVDGIPEAIEYATTDNSDGGTICLPVIGNILSGNLEVGKQYTGLLDEFLIEKAFTEKPVLRRYEGISGRVTSGVFDLGYTGTRITCIDAVYATPDATDLYFYYRTADTLFTYTSLESEWVQFEPGDAFSEEVRGKYVQLLVEFYPDGSQTRSPSLSSITIRYEPDMPPPPPADVYAIAGNGKVTLYWKPVNFYDIMGYEIYYGNAPGHYHGTGSSGGDSPVNVGNVNKYELDGLENGKLYYFAIVAYDSAEIPHRSIFSIEVSARPSGLLE